MPLFLCTSNQPGCHGPYQDNRWGELIAFVRSTPGVELWQGGRRPDSLVLRHRPGGGFEGLDDRQIVKIISVVDTREYVEDGDRFVPIPGSGQARECDRCGRSHEVHASVLLDDGSQAIVGTGCMGEESLAREARNALARAKKSRVEGLKYKRKEARREAWDRVRVEVLELRPPEHEVATKNGERVIVVGDAYVYWPTWHQDQQERVRAVVDRWRGNRMVERGVTINRPY